MIKHLVCVDDLTGQVDFALEIDNPDAGPARFVIPVPEGKRFAEVDEPFIRIDGPPTVLPFLVDGIVQWVETANLDGQRARKSAAISQACADAILAGFVSSALGASHTYPAKLTDQANLSGSVLASILPSAGPDWLTPFWCADATSAWEFRMHTASQIQQVGIDAKSDILAHMTTNEQLQARIMTADAVGLRDINWPA